MQTRSPPVLGFLLVMTKWVVQIVLYRNSASMFLTTLVLCAVGLVQPYSMKKKIFGCLSAA